MNTSILKIDEIADIIRPIIQKYNIAEVYIFGSYARNEVSPDSDIDFLVSGGDKFRLTDIFAFAEELRRVLDKKIDVFEINEVNENSDFYRQIMNEKVLVA